MSQLISVCIPTYKQPHLLRRALTSALSQEGCDYEVVVTDDTPGDAVKRVVDDFASDARLRYFHNPVRLGAVGNWNRSIEKAKGEIVKVLHQDDWFASPDSLRKAVEPILEGRACVTFSACFAMGVDERELFLHCAAASKVRGLKADRGVLVFDNFIGPPSVMAFSKKIGLLFDVKYIWLADVDFYIRVLDRSDGVFVYINESLVKTTAESPVQLSRDCEANKLRTVREYISLLSERLLVRDSIGGAKKFAALVGEMGVVDKSRVLLFAFLSWNVGLVVAIWLACFLPGRVWRLFKWKH